MQRFLAEIDRMAKPPLSQYSSVPGFLHKELYVKSPVLAWLMGKSPTPSSTFTRKAFISYAWPPPGPERTHLQSSLVRLVQDMSHARIDVTLDILRLRVGMNINDFMRTGIHESNAVLWIGTPGQKDRIKFNDDGTPANPVTIEYVHIKDKAKSSHGLLFPLWFSGSYVADSYPTAQDLSVIDFRNEKEYFHRLPRLAAALCEVAHMPAFRKGYSQYLTEIRALEANFTEDAISKRLEQEKQAGETQQLNTEMQLQQLLENMPEQYRALQVAAQEVQLQSLNTRIQQIREHACSPEAPYVQALSFYIPLKGGHSPDTPLSDRFDITTKMKQFFSSGDTSRVLMIKGNAGAGKSLFGRLVEHQLLFIAIRSHFGKFIPISPSLVTNPST
jgi:hypothetical protein